MAYKALYRKYRPKTFDEIIGQDHISKTLASQVSSGQIGHAYLFTGSRGTGKTSTAKIFAAAINCQHPHNGSPCFSCDTCKALSDQTNMDIIEIDAASNNRVDEIRDLREKIGFLPVSGKFKVYIIDEVHMLTESAFNALLKTLEEPPAHAVFILATTEVHKLPATILSRCMRFDFHLVPTDILKKHLLSIFKKEGIECEDEAAKMIAVAGEGSVRDTLSIGDCVAAFGGGKVSLDSVLSILGLNERGALIEFADALEKKDIGQCLEIVNNVYLSGKNLTVFARDIASHFRDLLVAKTCKNAKSILALPSDIFDKYEQQAKSIDHSRLLEYVQIFSGILSEMKLALSPRILLETAIVIASSGDFSKKN